MALIQNQIIVDTAPVTVMAVPASLPAPGAVLKVYVRGVPMPFNWTGANQITLRTAVSPPAVIDLESEFDSNESSVTAEASLNFPSIPANTTSELTISAFKGAAVGDVVSIGVPVGMPAGLMFFGYVSAATVVTIRAANVTTGAIDPPAGTFRVLVSKA